MEVLGRDLTQLYTPQAAALPGDLGKPENQPQPGQPGYTGASAIPLGSPMQFWDEPINKYGVRPSRFQGESARMTFFSSSHTRIYRDSLESVFAKITYQLEDPKGHDISEPVHGKMLVKHEDPGNLFIDDERMSSDTEISYTLVEQVKDIHFEYLDGEKDKWETRWDTAGSDHKGVYPAVIKATVEIYVPTSDNTFIVIQQYRPELDL
jgi:hypothetical protein